MRIEKPPGLGLSGIVLRQLERTDIAEWYEYLSIPAVIAHTSWDLQGSEELQSLLSLYESTRPTSPIRLAIIDESRSRLAGTVGLHTISHAHKSGEFTCDLHPDYWSRGIATALCRTITAWSYDTLGLQRVQATVLETNAASERVLQKCGFTYEGLLRAYRIVRGVPGNFRMYSRLVTDEGSGL
jgi:ribosomal-protein-alanine N-acetyltransferase